MRFLITLLLVYQIISLSKLNATELKLASVFSDHMVLQREKPICVWGQASPKSSVTVDFAGQTKSTTAQADGSWQVQLDQLPASSEPRKLNITSQGQTIEVSDVLVGEVWLLGGQSNMEMPLWWRGDSDGLKNAKDTRLVLGTNHPWLRIMTVPQRASRTPEEEFPQGAIDGDGVATGRWFIAEDKHPAISGFSALGYFLGVQLHEKLNVPIGLIDSSWGGTIASAWNSQESLAAIPEARIMVENKMAAAAAWSEQGAREKLQTELIRWEALVEAAKKENKNPPGRPELQPDPGKDRNYPAGPFNAMIWPLRKFSLQGVFFYQGENNYFDHQDPFAKTFPGVTTSWRSAFSSPDLPFCIFQICGWENADILYLQTKMPILQEQQHQAHLSLPNTGFVVTMDYPHADIHPMVKRVIAERAMRWARCEVYGELGLTWGSPSLESHSQNGSQILLNFKTFGDEALLIKGDPCGLVIAGKDGKFVEAKAKIVHRTSLAVWSDQVPEPVSVRYAWSQRPICRLYSASGLPVGPFRTDQGEIPLSEIRQ